MKCHKIHTSYFTTSHTTSTSAQNAYVVTYVVITWYIRCNHVVTYVTVTWYSEYINSVVNDVIHTLPEHFGLASKDVRT